MPTTYGRIHENPGNVELNYQPDEGWIWRKKHDDIHSSKVICDDRAFARVMRHNKIAHECGHRGEGGSPTPRPAFFKCMHDLGEEYHNKLEAAFKACGAK